MGLFTWKTTRAFHLIASFPTLLDGRNYDREYFLHYCSHQNWMGSINLLLSFIALSLLSINSATSRRERNISEKILETPRFEPGAAWWETRMPSTVLWGPPDKIHFFILMNAQFGRLMLVPHIANCAVDMVSLVEYIDLYGKH